MHIIPKQTVAMLEKKFKTTYFRRNAELIESLSKLDVGEGLVVDKDKLNPKRIRLGAGHVNRFFKLRGINKKFRSNQMKDVSQVVYIRVI